MRAHDFLFEARRNPEQNPKISELEQLEHIAEQYGYEDIYVRFVDIPKLGINPSSKYGTPFGICAYPLEYVIEKELNVPFAGEMPYIMVFEDNGAKLLELTEPGSDWTQDDHALALRMAPILKSVLNTDDIDMTATPNPNEDPNDNDNDRVWSPVWSWMYKNILQFGNHEDRGKLATRVLTQLGYEGVSDPGYGIIFSDEPEQTVFFNTSHLKVILAIDRHISDTFLSYGKPSDFNDNYKHSELSKSDTAATKNRISNLPRLQQNYERELAHYYRKHPGWSFEQLLRKYPYLIQYNPKATPQQIRDYQAYVFADPADRSYYYSTMPVDFQLKIVNADVNNVKWIPKDALSKEALTAAVKVDPHVLDTFGLKYSPLKNDPGVQVAAVSKIIQNIKNNPKQISQAELIQLVNAYVKITLGSQTPKLKQYLDGLARDMSK